MNQVKITTARLDAEVLLAYVLKQPVTFLLAHNEARLSFFQQWRYQKLIVKRKQGIPVAYLTGKKEFYFLEFDVTKDVLIPRPDTEMLVEAVLEYLNSRLPATGSGLLLDVGTGSGCIPISILKNHDTLEAIATDICPRALRIARRNALKHDIHHRISFLESDLLQNVPRLHLKNRPVVVTANLPYVPLSHPVTPGVHFEPQVAIWGGHDGLDLYRRFIEEMKEIKPQAIFIELLESQHDFLRQALPDYRSKTLKNLCGHLRFLILERN